MSDNLKEKVNALGERLKIGGVGVGKKVSAGMSSASFKGLGFKVKDFFQGPSRGDKLVEDATCESFDEPKWEINLYICDLINAEQGLNTGELVRAIKKRLIVMRNSPRVQYLVLVLLETLLKNCGEKAFWEVASERVLDEMVQIIDDPITVVANRNKALLMIEAWGESTTQLRYLPVYEETYKSLKSRGVQFPSRDNESLAPVFTPPRSVPASAPPEPNVSLLQLIRCNDHAQSFTFEQTKEALNVARNIIELLYTVLSSSPQQDELTRTLVKQCRESQETLHKIVESAGGDNESLLFEALNVNDEIQKVLSKYQELKKKKSLTTKTRTYVAQEPAAADVEPESEDLPAHFAKEDGLIRRPIGSRAGAGLSHDDMIEDLDEMIFGKKDSGQDPKKQQQQQSSSKQDFIPF